MSGKDKYGYQHEDGHYSKMTGNDTNSSFSVYDKNPSEPDHSAIHININTDTGKGSIVEHDADGESTKTDISCYLTTACMKKMPKVFDDNCYELTMLRWFRDQFVATSDINYYYQVAPIIVEAIDHMVQSNTVYDEIYHNIIKYCVYKIERGEYQEAYDRYKESILCFAEEYARPYLVQKFVKKIKKVRNTKTSKHLCE